MVKKLIFSLLLLSASELCFSFAVVFGASQPVISANQIKEGCVVEFSTEHHTNETNSPGSQPHEIVAKWVCKEITTATIDRYEVEGGSPQILMTFFFKRKSLVVLAKWSINSHASDFHGDFYKVYIYKYNSGNNTHPFTRQDKMMIKFDPGWDGVKNGITVTYPFKNSASIRSRLKQLNY